MNFATYLSEDRIILNEGISSKKKVLERLAEVLATQTKEIDKASIFDSLVDRERLGSTAMGKGIAIPHCRMQKLTEPLAALLRVSTGIDYDSPDGLAVTLFPALLVPEDATSQHLELLASLVARLNDEELVEQVLQAEEPAQILKLMEKNYEDF